MQASDHEIPLPPIGDRSSPPDPFVGQLVGDTFEIVRPLSEGGMASVYLARRINKAHYVAVKSLHARADHRERDDHEALFEREAEALRSVHHDAVVCYEGFLRGPGERMFLVMEYVEGDPLRDHIERGERLETLAQASALGQRIADGLAALHRARIAHRDISPHNIILPGGYLERAKIVDLGIVKLLDSEESIIGSRFAGKARYAAPEQLAAGRALVDTRCDVFSMALVIAEAYGVDIGRPDNEIEALELRQRPPDLRMLPEPLRKTLRRMLAVDPVDRPNRIDQFWRESMASRVPPSRPSSAITGGRPRSSWPLYSMVGVVAAMGIGGGAYWATRPGPSFVEQEDQLSPGSPVVEEEIADHFGPAPERPLAVQDSLDQAIRLLDADQLGLRESGFEILKSIYARENNGRAALAIAQIFDPQTFVDGRLSGVRPSERMARRWYERALEAGEPAAREALRRLGVTP